MPRIIGIDKPRYEGCDFVVAPAGSIADSGKYATHTSIQSAINAASAGGKILILNGTYAESITVNKKITLEGQGHNTLINGTLTVTSAGAYASIQKLKVAQNITIQAGANNVYMRDCWQTNGYSLSDSGSFNSILLIQE
jgi:nitrous oxidase accessory protein NosD